MTETLSKRAFYDAMSQALAPDGWVRFGRPSFASALFGKRVGDLVLTLGCFESDFHNQRVTAEFGLGGHTHLIMSFRDLFRARCRIGAFLSATERAELLPPEFQGLGVADAWWSGRSWSTIRDLTRAAHLAEPRFLAQDGLIDEIERNAAHQEYTRRLELISRTSYEPSTGAAEAPPPPEWVAAALELLSSFPQKTRARFAETIAADAWRTYVLLPKARNRSDGL